MQNAKYNDGICVIREEYAEWKPMQPRPPNIPFRERIHQRSFFNSFNHLRGLIQQVRTQPPLLYLVPFRGMK